MSKRYNILVIAHAKEGHNILQNMGDIGLVPNLGLYRKRKKLVAGKRKKR